MNVSHWSQVFEDCEFGTFFAGRLSFGGEIGGPDHGDKN